MTLAELNNRLVACTRCPRLVEYRQQVAHEKKRAHNDDQYWGKPVPGFGDPNARVLLVGLAPGAHGSNRTGRMFTGDGTDGMGASDFLMRTLYESGYASQPSSRHVDDGLQFTDMYMTAVGRCAPPANKPMQQELRNCAPWLAEELALLPNIRVAVALGKLAFDGMVNAFGAAGITIPRPKPKFGHGAEFNPGGGYPLLLGSYHPSRQNTQTGVLTPAMFTEIFRRARTHSERESKSKPVKQYASP